MARKRQRRPGPKSSKKTDEVVDEKADEGEKEEELREKASEKEPEVVEKEPEVVENVDDPLEVDEPEKLETSEKLDSEKLQDDPLEETSENPSAEESKPTLRLVPLASLLKPSLLDEKPKQKSTPTRKSRKNASYIEISSGEDSEAEMISIGSTSSDESSQRRSTSRRKRNKENNSTNKLSNGTGKHAMPKDLSINLEKMPQNVNKLMKCYRVGELREKSLPRIESWSDTDDFENMISTSKIDRVALDKKLEAVEEVAMVEKQPAKKSKRGSKESEEKETAKSKRPERSSAKVTKIKVKPVVDDDELPDVDSEAEEVLPTKKSATRVARKSQSPSDSDEPIVKKKKKDKKSSDDEESSTKKLKSSKKNRRNSSSSSEQEKNRAKKSKEPEVPVRATRSRRDPPPPPENPKKSSKKAGKSNDLKMKINFSKKEVVQSDQSDEESLMSEDEPLKPVKLDEDLKDEDIDGKSAAEISDGEKLPVLDQKFRNRNKFEANSAFNTLKRIMEKKKEKRKPSVDEPPKRSSRRNGNDAKEEKNNNASGEDEESEETVNFSLNFYHHR